MFFSDLKRKAGREPALDHCGDHPEARVLWFGKALVRKVILIGLFFTSLSFGTEAKADLAEKSLSSFSPSHLKQPLLGKTILIPGPVLRSWFSNPYQPPIAHEPEIEQIHIPTEPSIHKYIRYYQKQGRKTFRKSLRRSLPYAPMMASILKSQGLPQELVYTVLVESRFKNNTFSEKGAAGYWQLMPVTARSLGLRVDHWVDERMDPIKSTSAATEYLRMLYGRFGSWPLALTAYNLGETALTEIIEKRKKLVRCGAFTKETREYVPKVFAAILIGRNLEAYGFSRPRYLPVHTFGSVQVENSLDLRLIARWIDSSLDDLRALNPSLRQDCLPPGEGNFILHLPLWGKDRFNTEYQAYLDRSRGKRMDSTEN